MHNKKSNYDILFIGGVYEKNLENNYLKKSSKGIQNAVNIHQWNFIEGIDANNATPVDILSARYVEPYPKFKDIYIRKVCWKHIRGANDENIGFLNIKIIKNIVRKLKLEYKAKKWAKNCIDKRQKVIICYYPSIPQMSASIKAKKKNKKLKNILIVPDIPKFMNLNEKKSILYKIIQSKVEKKSEKLIKKFDGYILLTEDMKEALGIQNKKSIIIEGIINPKEIKKSIHKKQDNVKKVVYSGSLHKKYGMDNFIEAIRKIKDNNIMFYIFGSGEMENEIKELSKSDKRVKFMGYKERNIVLEYQRNATILINPRCINEEFIKYSFPSKLIEYMLSGTPVLTTKLPSIPKEYSNYLYYIDNNATPDDIKCAILKTINLSNDTLTKKGLEAQNFVVKNKNFFKQGKRIIELIDSIIKEEI